MNKLTKPQLERLKAKTQFTTVPLPEHADVRGNAMASGDDKADKECEDKILEDLERGNQWAWCTAETKAKFGDFVGTAYLGCCSYASSLEFENCNGDDMRNEAFADLVSNIEKSQADLAILLDDDDEAVQGVPGCPRGEKVIYGSYTEPDAEDFQSMVDHHVSKITERVQDLEEIWGGITTRAIYIRILETVRRDIEERISNASNLAMTQAAEALEAVRSEGLNAETERLIENALNDLPPRAWRSK